MKMLNMNHLKVQKRLLLSLLRFKIKWFSLVLFGTLMMLGVHVHQMGRKLESSWSLGGTRARAASTASSSKVPSVTPSSPSEKSPLASQTVQELTPDRKTFSLSGGDSPTESTLQKGQTSKDPVSPLSTSADPHAFLEKAGTLDLLNLTKEEFQVLQSLVSHQKNMREEENVLAQKEKKLEILQATLNEKMEQLQLLKASVEKLVGRQEEKSQQKLGEIVKMYESMKPQEAAQILAALDFNITIDIFSQMKGKKASAILANLPPEQAAQLTTALAQKSQDMTALAA